MGAAPVNLCQLWVILMTRRRLLTAAQIARRTKSLTQYISSPQWYVPRDNPLYTESQIARFKYIPFYEQSYRLRLAYAWENEAYKLKGGAGPAKTRAKVEGYFLSHLKATAPEKYVKQLTPQFPVRSATIGLGDSVDPGH